MMPSAHFILKHGLFMGCYILWQDENEAQPSFYSSTCSSLSCVENLHSKACKDLQKHSAKTQSCMI